MLRIKEFFQPYDYEYSLWDEIRRRTQGAQERILTYVVAMENLFRKLPNEPSADTKLNIVRRNLLPYLQSRLATHKITSMDELLSLGRPVEETEARIQRFTPPSNTRGLVEPSLAYQKPRVQLSALTENSSDLLSAPRLDTASEDHVDAVETGNQALCWNCGGAGHKFRRCPEPKQKFCFRCGKAGVVSPNCPSCTKNLRQGRSA